MNQYFTTTEGAVTRLMRLKRELGAAYISTTIVGRRKDGREVSGLQAVLLNARNGQLACFVQAREDQIVFIS